MERSADAGKAAEQRLAADGGRRDHEATAAEAER